MCWLHWEPSSFFCLKTSSFHYPSSLFSPQPLLTWLQAPMALEKTKSSVLLNLSSFIFTPLCLRVIRLGSCTSCKHSGCPLELTERSFKIFPIIFFGHLFCTSRQEILSLCYSIWYLLFMPLGLDLICAFANDTLLFCTWLKIFNNFIRFK